MATCSSCTCHETCDEPMPRNPNDKYTEGDVWGLKESIYTPIYGALLQSLPKYGAGSDAYGRCNQSLLDLTSVPDVISHPRPAIIMESQEDNDDGEGPTVCLATRYEETDISQLPRIFRHFSIPITPNRHMLHGALDHLHSMPEWGKENAFIIARPFQSTATVGCEWSKETDGDQVRWVFGKDAMGFLRAEIDRRWGEWQELCKNPSVAAELEAELRDHVKKRKERFYGGDRSKAASFQSVAMGVDAPSWRRPMTILEDSENDFILVTSGKPREPMPWKHKGKHRTGSTCSLPSAFGKKAGADKKSIKSNCSRTSLAQDGLMNRFDILRAVRVK